MQIADTKSLNPYPHLLTSLNQAQDKGLAEWHMQCSLHPLLTPGAGCGRAGAGGGGRGGGDQGRQCGDLHGPGGEQAGGEDGGCAGGPGGGGEAGGPAGGEAGGPAN